MCEYLVAAVEPEQVISAAKALSPELMERICKHGSCYRFHLMLKEIFPDAIPYMSAERDHVATAIGGSLYDIDGKLPVKVAARFHEMSETERRVASKWAYRHRN